FVLYPEIVEIDIASGRFGCKIEQTKTVPHKMRQGVMHCQWLTDLWPCTAIDAAVKIGLTSSLASIDGIIIAVYTKVNGILINRYRCQLDRIFVFISHHDN